MSSSDGQSIDEIIATSIQAAASRRLSRKPQSQGQVQRSEVFHRRKQVLDKKCTKVAELDIKMTCDEWNDRVSPPSSREKTLNNRKKRTAGIAAAQISNRWKDNIIHYTFDPDMFSARERRVIESAMEEWQKFTCLTFQKVEDEDESVDKLLITDGCEYDDCGCWSFVGRQGGTQWLSLSYDACITHRVVLHELGHAIGLWHEQNRPDRDDFISIVEENIEIEGTSQDINFKKLNWSDIGGVVMKTDLPYDFVSLMHYGKKAFGKGDATTIRTLVPKYQDVIGTAEHLSVLDISIVNMMYRCQICQGALL